VLKSVKIKIFRAILTYFYAIFDRKFVKIKGLKSFAGLVTSHMLPKFNNQLSGVVF